MKHIILVFLMASIFLFSCKKDHYANQNADKTLQKVSFNVGFSSSTGDFQTDGLKTNELKTAVADTSLTNHIRTLIYIIYDSGGKRIQSKTQLAGESDFGNYSFNLAAGSYNVIITGGGTGLYVESNGPLINYDFIKYKTSPQGPLYGFTSDTFYKRIKFTVAGSSVSQPVGLDRITSKVEINIKDAIPANVKSISVAINDISFSYNINSGRGIQGNGSYTLFKNISANQIGTSNLKFSTLLLTYIPLMRPDILDGPVSVTIGASSKTYVAGAPNDIAEKTFLAPLPINKLSILSGNLFGGNGGNNAGGIKVNTDTAWSSSSIIKSF